MKSNKKLIEFQLIIDENGKCSIWNEVSIVRYFSSQN